MYSQDGEEDHEQIEMITGRNNVKLQKMPKVASNLDMAKDVSNIKK